MIVMDLKTSEPTLIIGKNGVGKSNILDALNYGLFGKPYRKINVGTLINRFNNKQLYVEVSFMSRSHRWIIMRGMKPVIFKVYKDKVEESCLLPQQDARVYQDMIERTIIGFDEKIFRQIVTMGSGYYTSFFKLDIARKREIIEQLFELSNITIMKEKNKDLIKLQKQKILDESKDCELLKREITSVQQEVNRGERKNEEHQDKIRERKRIISEEIGTIASKINSIEEATVELRDRLNVLDKEKLNEKKSKLTSKVVILDKDISSCQKNIELEYAVKIGEVEGEIKNQEEEKGRLLDEKTGYQNKLGRISSDLLLELRIDLVSSEKDLEMVNIKLFDLDSKRKFYEDNDKCPTCGHLLSGDKIDRLVATLDKKISDLNSEHDNVNLNMGKVGSKVRAEIDRIKAEIQENIKELKIKIKEIRDDDSLELSLSNLHQDMNEKIVKNIKDLKEKKSKTELVLENVVDRLYKIEVLESEIFVQDKKMVGLRAEKSSLKKSLGILDENENIIDIEEIRDRLLSIDSLLINDSRKLKISERKLTYFEFLDKMLGDKGIRSLIINEYLPILNLKVSEFLDLFEQKFLVRFNDQFNTEIYYRRNEEVSYDSCSGGEKLRLDLSVLFTFVTFIKMKADADTNLIFFDEILDASLDEEGSDALMTILKTFNNAGKSIFVISHRETNQSRFDKIIEIYQESNFSKIRFLQ